MAETVDFIIPLRHPSNMRDIDASLAMLRATIGSVLNQSHGGWRLTIVSNPFPALAAEIPEGCRIVEVDLPPNYNHDGKEDTRVFYDAVQRDKGLRLKAGLDRSSGDHVMLLDDDDFIHRDLVRFVLEAKHPSGWFVDKGFHWNSDSRVLFPRDAFWRSCGSCYLVRRDLLSEVIARHEDQARALDRFLGSHHFLKTACDELNRPLAALPFRAAIKRRGHPNQHSQTGKMNARMYLQFIAKSLSNGAPRSAFRLLTDLRTYDSASATFGLPPIR